MSTTPTPPSGPSVPWWAHVLIGVAALVFGALLILGGATSQAQSFGYTVAGAGFSFLGIGVGVGTQAP